MTDDVQRLPRYKVNAGTGERKYCLDQDVAKLEEEVERLRARVEHLKGVTESYRREDEERGRVHRLSLKEADRD